MFVILKFVFFVFGKLGPSREPSRRGPLGHAENSCLETPTRVMLLSGYPQATLPGLRDRLTSLRNRPREIESTIHGLRYRSLVSLFPGFFFSIFQYELIQLDGHNGLMRKSGC